MDTQGRVVCSRCGRFVPHGQAHLTTAGCPPAWSGGVSELDDRHNRMASPEYQEEVKANMDRRAVEIGVDRLVGVASRPVSETVTVGAWQLEELLKYADLAEVALRTGFHPPEFLFTPADRSLRQCIEAVKEQRDRWLAAEGGR